MQTRALVITGNRRGGGLIDVVDLEETNARCTLSILL